MVVTGSRVITNGNDSPTPVTVVTTEELTTVRPGNLAEALNDMPVFNGSRGQNTNPATMARQAALPAQPMRPISSTCARWVCCAL